MKKITAIALLLVVTAATIPTVVYAHGDEGEVNLANGHGAIPIQATSPIGQEFIPAASPLGAVDVRLSVYGSGLSNVTVKIWEGRIDSAKGPIATTAQPVASGVPACTPTWVHFDFDQAVPVDTTGKTYVLELEAGDNNPYWVAGFSYPGGDAIVFGSSYPEMDFAFKTYTAVGGPPVIVNPGAPDLEPIENQSVDAGDTLLVSLWAFDPEGDSLMLGASGLPAFGTLTDIGDGTGYIEFAPGFDDADIYTIDVMVFDGAMGDTESFTLTVTVEGLIILSPLDLIEGVIVNLSSYVGESERFRKAIEEIEKSIESRLWVDEFHLDPKLGQQVFSHIRHAVRGLTHILKKSEVSDEALAAAESAIYDLVEADRTLAETQLNDATGGDD